MTYDQWKTSGPDEPPTCERCGEYLVWDWSGGSVWVYSESPWVCSFCEKEEASHQRMIDSAPPAPEHVEPDEVF